MPAQNATKRIITNEIATPPSWAAPQTRAINKKITLSISIVIVALFG